MLSFFPRDVLDEIWDLIESVSEGFSTYSSISSNDQRLSEGFFCENFEELRYIFIIFVLSGALF